MFDTEIQQLQQILKDRTIGSADHIALKHILESTIPMNVKGYFKADVEWLLRSERKKEVRSARFDHSQEDVAMLQGQIDTLLVYHFSYSEKEFASTLDRCIHFLFNYLCRPQWTLERYLFNDAESVSLTDLASKFSFCTDYRYYWVIAEKYWRSRSVDSVTKEEAVHLFRKIDAEIIREHTAAELAKMVVPLFEFVAFIRSHGGDTTLPVKSLIYFFTDKHLRTVSEHLTKVKDSGKESMTFSELVQQLKDSFVSPGFSIEDPFPTPAEEDKTHVGHGIRFPEKERQLIIRSLFGNEESRFLSVLDTIVGSSSWDDAALALDHYFTMNDIDIYSREAIVFTNVLQTYFSNERSQGDAN